MGKRKLAKLLIIFIVLSKVLRRKNRRRHAQHRTV